MAYEFKKLAEKLKKNGLEVAEDGAQVVANTVLEFIQEEALLSAGKVDDMLLPLIPILKPMLDAQIDKIDGQVG